MIRPFTIRKISSKALVSLILIFSAATEAQFRNAEDRRIVRDVLRLFGKECGLRAAGDGEILKRLEEESARARRNMATEVQKCYEASFSQITGVYFLYQKLCGDVAATGSNASDNAMARQILEISKYQSGIRPFQSTLNDCLLALPERKGRPYMVSLAGTELDVKLLHKQIEETGVKDPYPATTEPFR
jgi:hypothetical protein